MRRNDSECDSLARGAPLESCTASSGYQGSAAIAIPLDASGDITEGNTVAWRYSKGTPYVPSPLLIGDRLYFTQANNAIP